MNRTIGNLGKVLLLTALVASGLACSDDDGSGARCLVFAPAATPAAGTVVLRNTDASTCDILALEMVATDVTNIIAVDANISFTSGPVVFIGASLDDSLLVSDGVTVTPIVQEEPAGSVTIGLARQSTTPVDAVGDERLVQLFFALGATNGNSTVAIDSACLVGAGATPNDPPVVNPATCTGATISSINQ